LYIAVGIIVKMRKSNFFLNLFIKIYLFISLNSTKKSSINSCINYYCYI